MPSRLPPIDPILDCGKEDGVFTELVGLYLREGIEKLFAIKQTTNQHWPTGMLIEEILHPAFRLESLPRIAHGGMSIVSQVIPEPANPRRPSFPIGLDNP